MDSLVVDVHVLSPYSGFYNYHLDTGVAIATSKDSIDKIGQRISQPPSTYLRRFHYDCIVYTESALRYLIDTVGSDRVVFGTDWPYDMVFD
jgi:predicted TIM-barrel fold metal-dependent hydrolase